MSILMKGIEVSSGLQEDYYTWKEFILLELNTNADHFPSVHSKLAHIYSQMKKTCNTHIAPWARSDVLLSESVERMIQTIETVFGDPNFFRDSVNHLHSNFQKKWAIRFVDIRNSKKKTSKAGYDLVSRSLLDLVFYKMRIELKQTLVHGRDIDSLRFNHAIARLQDIDNRQRANLSLMSNRSRRQNLFQIPQWGSHKLIQKGNLIDLSAISKSEKGSLTQEEKDRHHIHKLCMYCGEFWCTWITEYHVLHSSQRRYSPAIQIALSQCQLAKKA